MSDIILQYNFISVLYFNLFIYIPYIFLLKIYINEYLNYTYYFIILRLITVNNINNFPYRKTNIQIFYNIPSKILRICKQEIKVVL